MDQMLTCQICFYKFNIGARKPKQLPCQHVICFKCINSLHNSQSIKCPFDNIVHWIRLNDIPNSLLTLNLMETTSNKTEDTQNHSNSVARATISSASSSNFESQSVSIPNGRRAIKNGRNLEVWNYQDNKKVNF